MEIFCFAQHSKYGVFMNSERLLTVIKNRMKSQGVSQSELARLLGRRPNFVSRVMNGQKNIDLDDLYSMARALRTTPMEILFDVEKFRPEQFHLKPEQEQEILRTDLNYELWALIKLPKTEEELVAILGQDRREAIRSTIKRFNALNLISFKGNLIKQNLPKGSFIFFSNSTLLHDRRVSIFKKNLYKKPDFNKITDAERKQWLSTQSDVLLIEYFTEEQLQERKKILKNLWEMILTQISYQDYDAISEGSGKYKLHLFSITDMEYNF